MFRRKGIFSTCLTKPRFSPEIPESATSHPAFAATAKLAPQAAAAGPQTAPAIPAVMTTVLFVAPIKRRQIGKKTFDTTCRGAAQNQSSESTSATPRAVDVIPLHDHIEATR